jgi:hypothetical protein
MADDGRKSEDRQHADLCSELNYHPQIKRKTHVIAPRNSPLDRGLRHCDCEARRTFWRTISDHGSDTLCGMWPLGSPGRGSGTVPSNRPRGPRASMICGAAAIARDGCDACIRGWPWLGRAYPEPRGRAEGVCEHLVLGLDELGAECGDEMAWRRDNGGPRLDWVSLLAPRRQSAVQHRDAVVPKHLRQAPALAASNHALRTNWLLAK